MIEPEPKILNKDDIVMTIILNNCSIYVKFVSVVIGKASDAGAVMFEVIVLLSSPLIIAARNDDVPLPLPSFTAPSNSAPDILGDNDSSLLNSSRRKKEKDECYDDAPMMCIPCVVCG